MSRPTRADSVDFNKQVSWTEADELEASTSDAAGSDTGSDSGSDTSSDSGSDAGSDPASHTAESA
jgi:hypothetical protein